MADGADAAADGVEKLAVDTAKKSNVRLLRTSWLAERGNLLRTAVGTLRTAVGAARVRAGYAGDP